jgi:hypothetical protein
VRLSKFVSTLFNDAFDGTGLIVRSGSRLCVGSCDQFVGPSFVLECWVGGVWFLSN